MIEPIKSLNSAHRIPRQPQSAQKASAISIQQATDKQTIQQSALQMAQSPQTMSMIQQANTQILV